MDALANLADGFATALTPVNLLFAVLGVLLGTMIGVLPGIGPAMAIALLLPVTYSLEATQAFIMFAGIYYGGMYGGSTTSILLNTPGESASVVTAIEGNKMAKKRPSRPGARHRGDRLVHRRHDRHDARGAARAVDRRPGRADGCARLLRGHGPRLRRGDLGARRLARPRAVLAAARPGHRPGRHRPDHRPAAAHLRRAAARRRHRRRRRRRRAVRARRGAVGRGAPAPQQRPGHPDRRGPDGPRGLAPLVGAVAARHGDRLPVRRRPGRRRGDPDLPQLRAREAPQQAPRGVRPRRDRGRRRSRGDEQRLRRRRPRAAADPRPAGHRHRGGPARRVPAVRHPARAAAARERAGARLGPARQPAHRQRDPARAQPAARPGLGQAAADPAALPLRRHPVLRQHRRLRRQQLHRRPGAAARLRRPRLRHAALRAAGAAGHHRRHPRPARRAAAAPGAPAQRRRPQRPGQHLVQHRRLRRRRPRAAPAAAGEGAAPVAAGRRTRPTARPATSPSSPSSTRHTKDDCDHRRGLRAQARGRGGPRPGRRRGPLCATSRSSW